MKSQSDGTSIDEEKEGQEPVKQKRLLKADKKLLNNLTSSDEVIIFYSSIRFLTKFNKNKKCLMSYTEYRELRYTLAIFANFLKTKHFSN